MQWQAGMGPGKNRGDPTKHCIYAFYLRGSVDGTTKFFNIELSNEWLAVPSLVCEMRARPGTRGQATLVARQRLFGAVLGRRDIRCLSRALLALA